MIHSTNIIVCCDGTKNTFGPSKTNVRRLFDSLSEDNQNAYYDPGVGTLPSDFLGSRLLKGASRFAGYTFAFGLTQNVLEGYRFLAEAWNPPVANDSPPKVFFFGFSRGALTIRRLAKMVAVCGLPPKGNTNLIPYAYEAYESYKHVESARQKGEYERFSTTNSGRKHISRHRSFRQLSTYCEPHFVGVWDTVRSVGLKHIQISCDLTQGIRHARHAVSYHEKRRPFKPELWTDDADRIKQLWFPGDHSDVGGGHTDINGNKNTPITVKNDLANFSLDWMISEAMDKGLRFQKQRVEKLSKIVSGMSPAVFAQRELSDKTKKLVGWRLLRRYDRPTMHEKEPIPMHKSLKDYLEFVNAKSQQDH